MKIRKRWLAVLPMAALGGALMLWIGRVRHERALIPLWQELQQPAGDTVFDPAMIQELPAPAQRYLRRAIAPGTPLARSVKLTMHGAMRLQPGGELLPMQAEQILAPPYGLVWKAHVGKGLMRFQGFDRYGHGQGAMRWWLFGLVPLVQAGGPDVSRSAAGRLGAEAAWMPAALLPQHGAEWTGIDETSALVRFLFDNEPITLTLSVDAEGRLQQVSLMRWRDDAVDGRPGYARFVADEMTEERTFGGYTIPARIRVGWRLGEPDEFPFFYGVLDSAVFR